MHTHNICIRIQYTYTHTYICMSVARTNSVYALTYSYFSWTYLCILTQHFFSPFLFLLFRHAHEIWCTRRKHRTKLHTPNASGCEGFLCFSPLISGFVVLSSGFRCVLLLGLLFCIYTNRIQTSVYILYIYNEIHTNLFCIYTIRYTQTYA